MKKRGISLIALVITIVVITILAATVILSLSNSGIIDKSKKARFMSDFTSVQDGVNIYSSGKYNETTGKFDLPLKGYLTQADKVYIYENIPTLSIKIQELSGSIDSANLAWINSEDININLSREKREKGYIMDVTTGQIYDYNGDVFEGQKWHTLDGGIDITNASNGYIKLTLFYPAGSTQRQWRLGNPGELRLEPSLQWQYYTSPINIPIYRIEDVWIRYVLNEQDITIPPMGALLVDIIPDEAVEKVEQVNVTINYDVDATTKEYRIGNSGWIPYTEPFVVTENTIVAARSTKIDETKDSNGNVILVRDIYGSDKIYIGNIGIEESDLVAPIIERLDPIDASEKARVRVTYPIEANQKIYKVNYGLEENYVEEISIKEWNTNILAYYYDATGRRSKGATILINDPMVEPEKQPEPYDPIDTDDLNDPNNPNNPNHPDNPNNPNNPFSPNNPNNPKSPLNPSGKYNPNNTSSPLNPNYPGSNPYDPNDPNSPYNPNNPNNPFNPENPDSPYNPEYKEDKEQKLTVEIIANPEPLPNTTKVSTVIVSINYDSRSTEKTYKINDGELQNYTGDFEISENSTIYAYAKGDNDLEGSATKMIDNLLLGISEPVITPNPSEPTTSAIIKIGIQYDKNATIKKYSVNGGELKDYEGEFEVTENGAVIYAYNENIGGENAESTYTITNVNPEQPTQVEESPSERAGVLEKEKYYIMKLSYPENSLVKDYKFTENGVWTPYKQDGIMLIKSEYKDEVLANIQTNGVLQIEDDNGNTIDFNGDWYVINTTIEALIESLFMRWDLSELSGPQIVANTTMPVKQVTITEICPEGYKSRLYKVVKLGEEIPDNWQEYSAPFVVDTNNSTIFAKYINAYGEESAETSYKVTNIDEVPPVINLVANFVTSQKEISVKVEVVDDVEVDIVKWELGLQGESYFTNSGIEILNNDTVIITDNGIYTFYATDIVGNIQIYSLTVTNIVKTPPIVRFTPDGQTNIKIASTKVDVTTEEGAIENSSLQYVWSISNIVQPTGGWINFVNGETITKGSVDGTYYLWVKASNTVGGEITTKSGAFTIDNIPPVNPTMSANPTNWTTGNVIVTIAYSIDSVGKEYSLDGITWSAYTSGVTVSTNNTTVYARSTDEIGNESGVSSLTVTNIDNIAPTITLSNASPTTPVVGDTVTFTVTYSDNSAINNITLLPENILLSSGTANISVTGTGNVTRTITLSNVQGIGSKTITITSGTATDIAGNTVSEITSPIFNVLEPRAPITYTMNTAGSTVITTPTDLRRNDILVFNYTNNSNLNWTVPFNGEFKITSYGAKGGGTTGGKGGKAEGVTTLYTSDILNFKIHSLGNGGGAGGSGTQSGSIGGAGSVLKLNATVLIAAAGGGGAGGTGQWPNGGLSNGAGGAGGIGGSSGIGAAGRSGGASNGTSTGGAGGSSSANGGNAGKNAQGVVTRK